MSRLLRQAGPRIGRFGRSVATKYALTREVAGLGRQVPVFRVNEDGGPARLGTLHFLAGDACWFQHNSGLGQYFPGLPPFLEDMRPQGYIGRGFPSQFPELKLPGRISDWNDSHHLMALAMRGEDCVGNLLIGEESLNRLTTRPPSAFTRADYPSLASGTLAGQPGSSAGGEHPKFAVFSEGRHVIFKFSSGNGDAAQRWRDLLVCEHIALQMIQKAGRPAPRSAWVDIAGTRFLEVDRFDRIGSQGRRGIVSLHTVNAHYLGEIPENWSRAARQILEEPALKLSAHDADQLVWLDTFGDLIGNTDRHFGNFSFFAEAGDPEPTLIPSPVYDMLPMVFAPSGPNLVHRPFTPHPPNALNLHLWHQAADHALNYWGRLSEADALSPAFRLSAAQSRETLARLMAAHARLQPQ